jgi:hypothetical protein
VTVSGWVVARKTSRVDQEIQTHEACQGALAKAQLRLGAGCRSPETDWGRGYKLGSSVSFLGVGEGRRRCRRLAPSGGDVEDENGGKRVTGSFQYDFRSTGPLLMVMSRAQAQTHRYRHSGVECSSRRWQFLEHCDSTTCHGVRGLVPADWVTRGLRECRMGGSRWY